MTIPKTHPLYGAVEAMREEFDSISVYGPAYAIRVLEAAGYKVVGPEPTREMVSAGRYYTGKASLRLSIAAAPTITGTEKSDE